MKRLRDEVRLDIVYDDQTSYGSALSGRADATVRQACAGIAEFRKSHGVRATLARSRQLWEEAFSRELSVFYRARDVLREECLFPAAHQVIPAALIVVDGQNEPTTIALNRAALPELASWIFELQCGTLRPASSTGRMLFDRLESCGALTDVPIQADSPPQGDVLLVGHATVMVAAGARIVIDPFILPRSDRYPRTYQPHRVADLLPLDAALITHSHPDHFDLSTLLRLGPHMRICVPEVERESLLAVDMAARLEQLGFSSVHRVRPGTEIAIQQLKIRALPFFGEQATTGDILHPDVRNTGCTYLCESRDRRVFVIADSGRDHAGDVRGLAAAIRKQFGEIDVLFGGYRAFAMYPILYLFSSVARFLLFVPSSDLMVRQEIMNDGNALLDTAECCGAEYVVPYAAGGAPWYWERGLGWRPGSISGARTDPPPDEVVRLAALRGSSPEGPIASPVRVLLLHAGESLRLGDGDVKIEHGSRQVWPYDSLEWQQVNVAPTLVDGSMVSSARSVFRALEPFLNEWRNKRQLASFFFMRKDPGIRLRFLADHAVARELSELLDRLVDEGAVDAWFRSVYEPEVQRFGGGAAMEAVHKWFDADTTQWMRLDRLRTDGRAVIARDMLCAAVALDLVKATVPDRGEAWAVWCQYASSSGLASEDVTADLPVPDFESLTSNATPGEQEVLHAYEAANRTLSDELLRVWRDGQLCAGLRSVLAAIILFHFNRHGLDAAAHARIAWTMIHALDPAGALVPRQTKV